MPLYDVGPVYGVLSEQLRLQGSFFSSLIPQIHADYVTHNVTSLLEHLFDNERIYAPPPFFPFLKQECAGAYGVLKSIRYRPRAIFHFITAQHIIPNVFFHIVLIQ